MQRSLGDGFPDLVCEQGKRSLRWDRIGASLIVPRTGGFPVDSWCGAMRGFALLGRRSPSSIFRRPSGVVPWGPFGFLRPSGSVWRWSPGVSESRANHRPDTAFRIVELDPSNEGPSQAISGPQVVRWLPSRPRALRRQRPCCSSALSGLSLGLLRWLGFSLLPLSDAGGHLSPSSDERGLFFCASHYPKVRVLSEHLSM